MNDMQITLTQFFRSTWFNMLFKGFIFGGGIVVSGVLGFIAWQNDVIAKQSGEIATTLSEHAVAIIAVRGDIEAIRSEAEAIDNRAAALGRANTLFQTRIEGEVTAIGNAVGDVREDMATVKGILMQMRREDVAGHPVGDIDPRLTWPAGVQ